MVIDNVVEQGHASGNAVMVAYGAEGRSAGEHRLTLVHNTLVDRLGTRGPARCLYVLQTICCWPIAR